MSDRDYLELLELQQIIQEGVEEAVQGPVRVKAEIASLQHKANGHCYLELCQSGLGGPVAKARAVIWRSRFDVLSARFAEASGSALAPGMALVFEVRVNYSELYGLTLVIEDVDVEHTLGEAELRRRQTIERLDKEGLSDLQKELALPPVPYFLAVVSAADAAGYGDFRRHLLENEWGFAFNPVLFPATMQGDGAPGSIISALNDIEALPEAPDAVLILRGGGSTLDLACFDDYDLCAAIARLPIPVFTAIGHDRDTHVADMVACEAVKTPTALADLFVDAVAREDERIEDLSHRLRMGLLSAVSRAEAGLDRSVRRTVLALSAKVSAAERALSATETRIASANPRKLLERGYTLVSDASGRLVKNSAGVNSGDKIDIHFPDGTINCTVNGKALPAPAPGVAPPSAP